MRSFHWGSERRGQDWAPLENGAFNAVPDDWGQPDQAQVDNSGDWAGQPNDVTKDKSAAWGGQPGEAQENNVGDWGMNNPGTSQLVKTHPDFSWNTLSDAGQPQQASMKEHADFSWNETAGAGPSEIATKQQCAVLPKKDISDAGPSKNARTQEDAALNKNETFMIEPSKKKLATKDLAPKRKVRGSAGWESNNSHPIYAADAYVWGQDTDDPWTERHLFGGPIIRTRAGNKGRGKRGGSPWDSGTGRPAIVRGNSQWTN